jgi:hypothetical protein
MPCPECRRFTLMRTYLPGLGAMNGTVACNRCEYRDQFANTLEVDMRAADPLPETFTPQKREHANVPREAPLHDFFAWLRAIARSTLRHLLPPETRPPRRLARAHSTF